VYIPIDPRRRQMQDILRPLGAVLDAHLARGVVITQQPDGLLVRAQVVASIGDRLDGTWSHVERRLTHLDLGQAQMAAAARRHSRQPAGPIERTLGALGRLADQRDLRGLTLVQHASGDGWLAWHTGDGGRLSVLTFTLDELTTPFTTMIPSEPPTPSRPARPAPEPMRDRARIFAGRAPDGRGLRPQLASAMREALPVRVAAQPG
jgi:hypothetical protein